MTEIRRNTAGVIVAGRWEGQSIVVEDQRNETGGYLIVIGPNSGGEQSGDMWIEAEKLEDAFEDAGWQIEWTGDSAGTVL